MVVPEVDQLKSVFVPLGHAFACGFIAPPLPPKAFTKAHLPSALVSLTQPSIRMVPPEHCRLHAASPPLTVGWNVCPHVPAKAGPAGPRIVIADAAASTPRR